MKKILMLLSITIVLCTCSLSLSFSYFIPNSSIVSNTIDYLPINNELSYEGESVIAPYEEKDIKVTITSKNEYKTVFKLYHKDNLNITCVEDENEIDELETIIVIIHVKNDSDQYCQLNLGIKSALKVENLSLKEDEEWI